MRLLDEKELFYKNLYQTGILLVCGVVILLIIFGCIFSAFAQTIPSPAILTASWYSVESLKKEGTFKYSKGRCADGSLFKDNNLTAASRDYSLGAILRVTNLQNGKQVTVRVTDRIGKRFKGKRIDLSKLAFSRISKLEIGIVAVKVEVIR